MNKMFDTVCCILMHFFMYVMVRVTCQKKLGRVGREVFFF